MYVEDSVAISRPVTGRDLLEHYMRDITILTFGLVRMHGTSMRIGPIELLRFGTPRVSRSQVTWPIEGGLAAGKPGGAFKVRAGRGRLVASLEAYRPLVPPLVYTATQLPVHHLLTRLYLLRVRGRLPPPGTGAAPGDRFRAASIDVAFCATLARIVGRRRLRRTLAIAAAYPQQVGRKKEGAAERRPLRNLRPVAYARAPEDMPPCIQSAGLLG